MHDQDAEFRVWAPLPKGITLRLIRTGERTREIPMRRNGEDFIAVAAATAGDRYAYLVDNATPVPDPVSRLLPEGVHGPPEIIDPVAFHWNDDEWRGLALRDYVIYELHVGAFTHRGTFYSAIAKL